MAKLIPDSSKITVAVSCVGSGIGQSIVNSCRLSQLPLRVIGFDMNPLTFARFDCDVFIESRPIESPSYVQYIIAICKSHSVDLIFPGTDQEVSLFSKNKSMFEAENIGVVVADFDFIKICRNKRDTYRIVSNSSDVFVGSFSQDEFKIALSNNEVDFPVIIKPSGGSASKGVQILKNTNDLVNLSEDCVIQELAKPRKSDPNYAAYTAAISEGKNTQLSEISIQLVTSRNGDLLGKMATQNRLKNGVPVEILPVDEPETIWDKINDLLPVFKNLGLCGPLNLQGRITDKGLKLFELNARFTGITGLRAKFGFNEVEACIKSWLGYDTESLIFLNNAFGVRQYCDRSVSINNAVHSLSTSKPALPRQSKKKIVLLTGATGYLGSNLANALIQDNPEFELWPLVRNKSKAVELLSESVQCYDENDLNDGRISIGAVDYLVHSGFARPHCTEAEIASSLKFTSRLFQLAAAYHVPHIINISSQSVYGQASAPPWDEKALISPMTAYGASKYASELLLSDLTKDKPFINTTSLRLSSLCGFAKALVKTDIISRFVDDVKAGKDLTIYGGMQIVERLDVHDAVSGVIALLKTSPNKWQEVYNLGSGKPLTLIELANKVVKIGAAHYGKSKSVIKVVKKDVNMKFGLNPALFITDTHWKPVRTIEDSIHSLFQNN